MITKSQFVLSLFDLSRAHFTSSLLEMVGKVTAT